MVRTTKVVHGLSHRVRDPSKVSLIFLRGRRLVVSVVRWLRVARRRLTLIRRRRMSLLIIRIPSSRSGRRSTRETILVWRRRPFMIVTLPIGRLFASRSQSGVGRMTLLVVTSLIRFVGKRIGKRKKNITKVLRRRQSILRITLFRLSNGIEKRVLSR